MENENNTRVWFNKSVTSIALRDAGCAQVFWDGFNNGPVRWTEECVASFLKALKIPVKFFLGLSRQAMEEVLTSLTLKLLIKRSNIWKLKKQKTRPVQAVNWCEGGSIL